MEKYFTFKFIFGYLIPIFALVTLGITLGIILAVERIRHKRLAQYLESFGYSRVTNGWLRSSPYSLLHDYELRNATLREIKTKYSNKIEKENDWNEVYR